MYQLKIGIAGYGIVGKLRGACVERHPNMRLVAVCDRIFEDEEAPPIGVRYFTNYQDLLKEKLDALFVCMTTDLASQATIAGLEHGLNVFCEKPPGRDLDDITRVIRCERKQPNLKLMYGFNHRYHESVIDALRIIRSGKLGSIINLRGVYGKSKLITFNQSDWRTKRAIAGGGVLLDQGIHMVDLMRLFAGEFVEVQSIVTNSHWGYDVEDNAYALMRTEDGIVGLLNSSATQWRHRFHLDLNLERGSIILGGILSGTKSYGAETLTVLTMGHDNDNGEPKEKLRQYHRDQSWQMEIDHFAESILEDKPIENGTSSEAFKTMKLLYTIYYADPKWRKSFSIPNPKKITI